MKTMTEIVSAIRAAQRKCLKEMEEIRTNYGIGIITVQEYISQTNVATLDSLTIFHDDEDVSIDDYENALIIINFMECNDLQLKSEK